MKGYFLESAKEIIRAEGVRALSVRTVAERAGYSYATLYNYYKNLKDLLFHCISDFMEECRDFVANRNHPVKKGDERLISLSLAYANYFVQYPGIFELAFLEKMPDISANQEATDAVYNCLDLILDKEWNYLMKSIEPDSLSVITESYKSLIHGMLLFYLNKRIPSDYPEFLNNFRERCGFFLENSIGRMKKEK